HTFSHYCSRTPQYLLSFPTRRSSDLYKDIKETSATVRFRCADEDAYYLAWTTTPWTLPSNVCLCVNAHVEYCRARKDGETFILRSEEHTSELQSRFDLVCRLLLEKKN